MISRDGPSSASSPSPDDGNKKATPLQQLLLPFTRPEDRSQIAVQPVLRNWADSIADLIEYVREHRFDKSTELYPYIHQKLGELLTSIFVPSDGLEATTAYRVIVPPGSEALRGTPDAIQKRLTGWSSKKLEFVTDACQAEEALPITAELLHRLRAALHTPATLATNLTRIVQLWSAEHPTRLDAFEEVKQEHILIEEALTRIITVLVPHTAYVQPLIAAINNHPDNRVLEAALDGVCIFARHTQGQDDPHVKEAREALAEALYQHSKSLNVDREKANVSEGKTFCTIWLTLSHFSPEAIGYTNRFLDEVRENKFRYQTWAVCAALRCVENLKEEISPALAESLNNPDSSRFDTHSLLAQNLIALLQHPRDTVRAYALSLLYSCCPDALHSKKTNVLNHRMQFLTSLGTDIAPTERLAYSVILALDEARGQPSKRVPTYGLKSAVLVRWPDAKMGLESFVRYAKTLPQFLKPLWDAFLKR